MSDAYSYDYDPSVAAVAAQLTKRKEADTMPYSWNQIQDAIRNAKATVADVISELEDIIEELSNQVDELEAKLPTSEE